MGARWKGVCDSRSIGAKMKKRECPICSEPLLSKPETLSETYGIRGEEVTVETQGNRCTGCWHRFLTGGKPWDSADAAYRACRARHDKLLPKDIRAFRLKMDMTQVSWRSFSPAAA